MCIFRHSIYSRSSFTENRHFFVLYKKIKFKVKKFFTRHFICLFYTDHKKMLVFHKSCHAHVEHQDVHANFLFEIFWHAKMFFRWREVYAPMCQSEFPQCGSEINLVSLLCLVVCQKNEWSAPRDWLKCTKLSKNIPNIILPPFRKGWHRFI